MGLQNFSSVSHRCREKGMGPTFLRKWNRFFFSEPSSDKNFRQGWVGAALRSKACKFLARGPNQPRGPRRGGETSASLLNWSHWDPQVSPCRTRRKAIKIWPCGSDEELGGEKAKKKDCFRGRGTERTEENRGGRGASWGRSRGDEGDKRGGLILRGCIQASLCASREPDQGGLVLSAIKPVLHVWWCSHPIKHLYSAQVLAAVTLDGVSLAWDQTLDEAGVVIHSMLEPQRNKHNQSNPEIPSACQTHRRPARAPTGADKHTQ